MTLRVGLLGLGYFAQFHREAWGRIEGATLTATADADPARGANHPTLAGLLETAPDVVDIATPPDTHAVAIREALRARPRLVICQKPFCTSLEEAAAVTAEAEAASIPLAVHENFRFQPWFRALRAALDAGRIGRPLQITMRLRPGDGREPDAYRARQPYFRTMPRFLLHETGVHYLDTFRYLAGEPDGVYADLRRLNPAIRGEDAGLVILDHRNGLRCVLDGNRLVDHASDDPRLTFGEAMAEGDAATIHLTGDGRLALRRHGEIEEETLLAPRAWPGFAGDSVHAFQSHLVAHLRDGARLETDARGYLRNLALLEACYASNDAKARLPV
ncbi:Gfo/Idh/MocA family protein [Jannaschia sp. W003]|uniref:Gfo/Idh/MocA family protein n=1 Tax=Jannaschia sp. W003 TaxID=2867012 RepID=UPI0021A45934|nr:Gfo/Idh/MocA family oxidoreductase [Jannaschia sp. W003]UWQ20630.1 Gfo/Idh/MocA family oxidoreductase [Jannaschia sp. W003]